MFSTARLCTTVFCLVALTIGMAAQAPPPSPGQKTGNPTPGTPQPDPPILADRITLTGCVQRTAEKGSEKAGGNTDPNTPSDSRFVLTKAERKNTVPAGTGASPVAAASRSRTYRLNAIDSQLSPFVGTKVEISGEVLPLTPKADAPASNAPTLQVEFVQKVAPACS